MSDLRLPAFYALSRTCPMGDVPQVLAILAITPIEGVIISDLRDLPLAREMSGMVVHVNSEANALAMAAHLAVNGPIVSLVIGPISAGAVQVTYNDGTTETIPYTPCD